MLDRLFSSAPRRELNDPIFGPMTCDQSVWTGTAHANGSSFQVFVMGGPEGPSAQQRQFFEITIERLAVLSEIALQYIRGKSQRSDLPELTLYAFEIGPDVEIAEHRFTLELAAPGGHEVHRVEFRNSEPLAYGCDD